MLLPTIALFYLKYCAEKGIAPNKPYSGKILLRVKPALHAQLVERAAEADKSLNEAAEEAPAEAAGV